MFLVHQTPYGTWRVDVPETVAVALDPRVKDFVQRSSCWGGADKEPEHFGQRYRSFEYRPADVGSVITALVASVENRA